MLNGEEMEETEIPGLIADQQTFFCGNVGKDVVLQVTTGSVSLFSSDTKQKLRSVFFPLHILACSSLICMITMKRMDTSRWQDAKCSSLQSGPGFVRRWSRIVLFGDGWRQKR